MQDFASSSLAMAPVRRAVGCGMRVVSLLPSATEIVLGLIGPRGMGEDGPVRLVGRSHECDWPPDAGLANLPVLTSARTHYTTAAEVDRAVRECLSVGSSLYTLDTKLLRELRPDLIITQDLCEVCSIDLGTVRAAAAEMSPAPAILSLNPGTFEQVLDDVERVGRAMGMEREARAWIVRLRERAYRAEEYVNAYAAKPSVAFLEWTEPLFVGGHWTPQLVERAGGSHPLNPTGPVEGAGAAEGPIGQTLRTAGKSMVVSAEQLEASRPDFVVVCPCGLALEQAWEETGRLAEKHWWKELPAVGKGRVAVVDGNQMFNRPGPRLVDGLEFLVGFVNGVEEMVPAGFPWRRWHESAG